MICSNGRNNTFAIDVEIQARPFIETRFSAEPMSAFNADAMDEEITFNQPRLADTFSLLNQDWLMRSVGFGGLNIRGWWFLVRTTYER